MGVHQTGHEAFRFDEQVWQTKCHLTTMNKPFTTTPTHLCSQLVTIARKNPTGESDSIPANLEAIGEWTLLVLTEHRLRRGTGAIINAKGHILNGIVEGCNLNKLLGYYIQVRLKPESRW